MEDELTPEEMEALENARYNTEAYCEMCYQLKPCTLFRGKLFCKDCIDKIRIDDGHIAYV